MRNRNRSALALTAALAVMGALAASAQTDLKSRTFKFTYSATVKDIPAGAKTVDLWIPYPQSDANQTIHQVKINAPGQVTVGREPRYGNQAVHFLAVNPTGPVKVSLEVLATRRENAGLKDTLTSVEAADYLKAEPLVPLDGPVKAVALDAVKGKRGEAQKARGIYEKVTAMMKYDKSGTGWGRGDAIFACDAKRGNCTDFHALIIGAARSQGIPARFGIGFSVPEQRGAGEIAGYHCWAEMYVKGEWVPVDSSEAAKALANGDVAKKDYFYGHHDENRIEFSRGRHITLSPTQKGEPLNFFVYPYAEVDGKKHDAVDRKFGYADVTTRTALQ
jgi:transglutaminase-like putative cysteine protease